MDRVEELEQALDEALRRWDSCLRFKGSYLVKVDKDEVRIDELRKVLYRNGRRSMPVVRPELSEADK